MKDKLPEKVIRLHPITSVELRHAPGDTKKQRFGYKVFERMFGVVGKPFSLESVGTPDWYLQSTWTSEQQSEFEDWLVREGMRIMRWGKKQAKMEAGWFLLFYGWRTKPKDELTMRKRQ